MTPTVEGHTREELVAFARELLRITSPWFPGRPGPETLHHLVVAAAFLVRCRSLLSGIASLVQEGEDDCIGVLYRTLLETYLSGVYALLGGEEAVRELEAAMLHHEHQIEKALDMASEEDRPTGAKRLPVPEIVQRVDRLLAEENEAHRGWTHRAYDNHYRPTSFHDAHGGLGCLVNYSADDDGQLVIRPSRENPRTALHLLDMAIALVLALALMWGHRMHKDMGALAEFHGRWLVDRPEP